MRQSPNAWMGNEIAGAPFEHARGANSVLPFSGHPGFSPAVS